MINGIGIPTLSVGVGRGRGTHHEMAEGTNGDMTVPISPCLPILLPGGAVIPAMKAATGLESPYKRKQCTSSFHHVEKHSTRLALQ